MVAGHINERSVFIRELLPQDLKIEIERLTVPDAMKAASFLAGVVGKAHARQMSEKDRKAWSTELERYRTKALDAPSWLWSSDTGTSAYSSRITRAVPSNTSSS